MRAQNKQPSLPVAPPGHWGLAFLLLGCAGFAQVAPPADLNSIAIGLFLPADQTEAASLRQGAELAVAHLKKTGVPVELLERGRSGQWGVESDEAALMVFEGKVRGLIAPIDGLTSHLMLQVAGRTRIPVVSLASDLSVTSAGIPWMVSIAPDNGREARYLFAGAASGTGCRATQWAAVIAPGRAGRQAALDLKQAAELSGIKLNPLIEISAKTEDFTNGVSRFLSTGADGVLLWVEPVLAGKIARALREARFAGTLAGSGRLRTPAFLNAAGAAAEGIFVPGMVLTAESTKLRAQLAEATKTKTELDQTMALAYDAVRLLAEHLRQSGNHPAFQEFPRSAGMTGATGVLKFDRAGARLAELELYACRQGRFAAITSATKKP